MNIVAASLSDTTNSSNVTFTFSEAPGASFTDSDVVTAGGTLSALVMDTPTTYHATFTATDGVTTTGSVSVAAGAYTDPVGNLGGAGSDTVSIDTENPTGTIAVSDSLITDADIPGPFTVTVTYSEAMNTAVTPNIAFTPAVASTLSFSSGAWSVGNTVYTASYSEADANVTVASVQVDVTGGQDLAGNTQAPSSQPGAFTIDTQNPTLTVNIVAASLSDTTNSSNVTFTFSEAPGASFTDSDVVTAGGTLGALVMDTPTTYHATFTATDGVTTTGSVSVAAGAYTDPVGNLGGAGSDTVSIDTENPTGTIAVSDSLITDADIPGPFTVTVTYSEAMNTAVTPNIAFTPAVASTLSFSSGAWSVGNTVYTASYSEADANVTVASVQVDVTGGQDLAGNTQAPSSQPGAFTIDTQNPTLTVNIVAASLSDTTNGSNVTFTFSEAPGASFTDSDVVTAGGTLSALVMDTPTTYHATFTATDGVTTTGSVSVAAGAYTDPVGNLGGAGSDTVSIDTQNPTLTVNIVAASLSDTTNSSNVTFTFSEVAGGQLYRQRRGYGGGHAQRTGDGHADDLPCHLHGHRWRHDHRLGFRGGRGLHRSRGQPRGRRLGHRFDRHSESDADGEHRGRVPVRHDQ